MIRTLPIARKIALAVTLFLLPVAFILWLLNGVQEKDIIFATREVAGANALRGLLVAEAALDAAILGGSAAGPAISAAVAPAQLDFATLGLADDQAALIAAAAADPVAVRTRLRALIAAVGDHSNLILDNVLDSYYATDVVLNRVPDLLDDVTDLRALAARQGTSSDARAAFLVAQGGLDSVLSGMDGSLQSALQDNTDGTLAPAVREKYDALKQASGRFTAALRGTSFDTGASQFTSLLGRSDDFAAACTAALHNILQQRVATLRRTRWLDFLATIGLFIAAAAATHRVILVGVVRRINRLRNSMHTLAADTDVDQVPGASDRDEIGDMARTVQVFRENRLQRLRAEQDKRREEELRDRRQQMMDLHTVDFSRAVAGTMTALANAARAMHESAAQLQGAADLTGTEVDSTARAAEDSSGNLATVAAAVEEMSSSSSEIARRVAETASIARGAVRSSESTDSAMRGLSEAATRIGAIAGAIEQIAGRTNLLALNATIEAAHAGEAGRGFAVVASEVKQLAQQTARATAEIGSQISEIRAAAEGAIAAMAGVTAAIREVDEVAAAIAAAAEQQGAATREIAGNVGMVANATAQAAGSMRQVSHTALQTRGMSATVAEAAAGVTRQSDGLRAEVEHFLDAVRATASDRRRYERHPVANVAITLRVAGRTVTGKLQNVSLGGFRVAPALAEPPGTEVCVALPGATVDVAARIVGSDPTGTSLFFAQSEGAHHVVADVIARLVPESRAAA